MNTGTRGDASPGDIGRRKQDHLSICADPDVLIESPDSAWFDRVSLIHTALPESEYERLDMTVPFLGRVLSFPFLISSMTGGSREALSFNRELARAAQETRVALGLGSVRIALERPETVPDFQVRDIAPDVPVFANLSAVQLRDGGPERINDLLGHLEADALAVHLNPGQELMQRDGDRDFRGLLDAIVAFAAESPFPVIVKETGFGIRPALGRRLLAGGVAWVDIAGSGGTNWMLVDAARNPGDYAELVAPFHGWGLPTALVLDAWRDHDGRVIASGGIRSGVDIAKAIALGAGLAGAALPFVRPVLDGGAEAAVGLIERYRQQFSMAMFLSGASDIASLSRVPLLRDLAFRQQAAGLEAADGA